MFADGSKVRRPDTSVNTKQVTRDTESSTAPLWIVKTWHIFTSSLRLTSALGNCLLQQQANLFLLSEPPIAVFFHSQSGLSGYVSDIDGHIPFSRFPSVFHPSCPSTIFVYLLKWLVVDLTSRMSDFDSRTISMSVRYTVDKVAIAQIFPVL